MAPALQRHRWARVVFDEAQTLTLSSRNGGGCMSLPREITWILTGTPLKCLDDLLTYAVLLQHPLAVDRAGRVQRSAWKHLYRRREIVAEFATTLMRRATAHLSTVREHAMAVTLDAEERAAYDEAAEAERRRIPSHVHSVDSHAALTRLRRILSGCDRELAPPHTVDAIIEAMPSVERSAEECPVCYESTAGGLLLPCGHHFCRACMVGWLDHSLSGSCPLCRHTSAAAGMRRTAATKPAALPPEPPGRPADHRLEAPGPPRGRGRHQDHRLRLLPGVHGGDPGHARQLGHRLLRDHRQHEP